MQNPIPHLYGAAVPKPGVYIGVRPPRGVFAKSDQVGRRQGLPNRLRSARFSQAGAVLRRPPTAPSQPPAENVSGTTSLTTTRECAKSWTGCMHVSLLAGYWPVATFHRPSTGDAPPPANEGPGSSREDGQRKPPRRDAPSRAPCTPVLGGSIGAAPARRLVTRDRSRLVRKRHPPAHFRAKRGRARLRDASAARP
jgi:hypothetical protein